MKRYPTERYDRDVAGMPAYAAIKPFEVLLGPDSTMNAIPEDDENCAIALGCKVQLGTPYVSVGRSRTDLALPHPKGVIKPGYGTTKWAVYRFNNPASAVRVIIDADTGNLNEGGVLVELMPPRPTTRPAEKKRQNTRFRENKGVEDGRGKVEKNGQDRLTILGVRNLTGHRRP